jgi:hypothetical protein
MSYSSLSARKGLLAATFVALAVVAVSACNGPSAFSPSTSLNAPSNLKLGPATKPSPTPYDFSYQTVDDPGSKTVNWATSINELNSISGCYGGGTISNPSHGYISMPPYTKFRGMDYPGAVSTCLMSMSTDHLRAGYFIDNTKDHNTWGFVQNHGIYGLYKDPKTPKGHFIDRLLSINGSDLAVGYYVDSSGNDQPFELIVALNKYTPLEPPGAQSAMATGINLRGDISGTETLSGGKTEGWLLRGGSYTTFSYPGSTSTQANGLDFQEQIVGSYIGSDGATHGFILTNPTSPSDQFWQTVDAPGAAGTTVLTGMNAVHSIVGWYIDSNSVTHGFTAAVAGSKDAR